MHVSYPNLRALNYFDKLATIASTKAIDDER
jgi:hypothetical protein